MQYRERVWAEVSLDALSLNVENIKKKIARAEEDIEYCAVVKADAYGHGEEFICRHLYEMGIRFYAVSSFEEAVRVRKWCPDGEILILGYTAPECAPMLAEYQIIQTIVSVEYAKELAKFVEVGFPVRCHIALDTGMGRIGLRTGLETDQKEHCIQELKEIAHLEGLNIEGLFTHFAVADEKDPDNISYTIRQETEFFGMAELFEAEIAPLKQVHCMNSAAILYQNQLPSTLARAGIIMYGLKPNANLEVPIPLTPVLSLRSRISHIKTVPEGTCISYGRTYTTPAEKCIATVTIGYADGYSRQLSNRGEVIVKGVRCPIVGRVCMDQMMIDVSAVPDVQTGDIVTLIGTDGNQTITADDIAQICGTIGYEIVCNISKRVPRIFLKDGRQIHEDSLI